MPGMGYLTCNVQIGDEKEFIVPWQLVLGLILGQDFLSQNQLGITWGPKGVLHLRDNEDVPAQTAEEVISFPVTLATKITMPPRSLVIVSVLTNLSPYKNKTHFDFIPLEMSPDLGSNCIIYP